MPKAMHRALKKSAKKKGKTGRDADRYVYGAMENAKKGKKGAKGKAKRAAAKKAAARRSSH